MTKLEKLIQQCEQNAAERSTLEKEIEQLQAGLVLLEKEAEAAAQAGNTSLYREKRDAAQLATDSIFVCQKQMEKLSSLAAKQEAIAAWEEYAAAYNKAFSKAWALYEKARQSLFESFMDIVNTQNDALRMRQLCGEAVGIQENQGLYKLSSYDSKFPLQMIPEGITHSDAHLLVTLPDAELFVRSKLLDSSELRFLNNVVRWHKAVHNSDRKKEG